jgi:uncharacterized protein YjbI with pentapeptide repeats
LAKSVKRAWKLRWLVLGGLLVVVLIGWHSVIAGWLKMQFPGKTKWDYIEKLFIPIASPAAIGFGVWFLDKNAKVREAQREEVDNKNRALQVFIDRISAILLKKQVVYLAEAEKKLGPQYQDSIVAGAREVIKSQTLAILRIFASDTEKKSAVMRFLVESEVIEKVGIPLEGADLANANLSFARLVNAELSKAVLNGSDLRHARLINARLVRAKLNGANLNWANLIGAKLDFAELRGAKLFEALLSGTTSLYHASLIDADLRGANLCGANLQSANLSGANLQDAILSEADLKFVNLKKAHLNGADLYSADLFMADLQDISWDNETQWPARSALRWEMVQNIPNALKKQLAL